MSVISIITTFLPNRNVKKNILAIERQSDCVIICDNSPNSNSTLFQEIPNTIYIYNGGNFGLSKAFNQVLKNRTFSWKEEDFVIFFDQDSFIKSNHIQTLIDEYKSIRNLIPNIACLGPCFFNTSNHKIEIPKIKKNISPSSFIVKNVITSSLLTTYENIKQVNFWNENIFLDYADWDLCWRFQKAGFNCCMTNRTILQHSVGEGEKNFFFLKIRICKPIREYYHIRDALYELTENYIPIKMRIRLIAYISIKPILHIIALDDKKERFKYILRGFKDYRLGIKGELNKYI